MSELMEAYQRTHETMGTIAKNVGKNNETINTVDIKLNDVGDRINAQQQSIGELVKTLKSQAELFPKINSVTNNLTTIAKLQQGRLDIHETQIHELITQVETIRQQALKMHKQIFWYLIAVIVTNIGSFVYWLTR